MRNSGGKGTGLGLALVRQIVKLSGGRLGVRSKVGHGSTFWVELRNLSISVAYTSMLRP
jgi:osomolarity two-component system sensor histidine kinase SLN1